MPHTDSEKKNELESIAAAFLVELKPNNPLSSYFSKSDDAVSLILGDHSPHSVKKKRKEGPLPDILCKVPFMQFIFACTKSVQVKLLSTFTAISGGSTHLILLCQSPQRFKAIF